MRRIILAALGCLIATVATAQSIVTTTTPGRACTAADFAQGQLCLNRPDGRLYFRKADGSVGASTLLNALPSGRKAVEQGDAEELTTLGRSLLARARDVINVKDAPYNAKCDGVTDDAAALQAWLSALTPGKTGEIPAGTCVFGTPLVTASTAFAIRGGGAYQTVLRYTGANTTTDLITVGNGTNEARNVSLSGFRIASDTSMTGGAGLHLRKFTRSIVKDVIFDGQDGNGKLWHGVWFDQLDNVVFSHFEARAQADAVRLNGGVGVTPKADLYITHGKISGSDVGIRVGGAFGGLFADQMDIIDNNRNVVIDTTLAAEANRELFFGAQVGLDSAKTGAGFQISDTLASSSSIAQLAGTWIASSAGSNLVIDPGVSMTTTWTGGTSFNSASHGVENNSTSSSLLMNGTWVRANKGYGVYSSVANTEPSLSNIKFTANVLGNFNPNVKVASYTAGSTIHTGEILNADAGVRFGSGFQCVMGARPSCSFGPNAFVDWNSATKLFTWYYDNGGSAAASYQTGPNGIVGYLKQSALPGYIAGLTLSNDAVTPASMIGIAAGTASASDASVTMTLASAWTKNLGAAWAAGTGGGALDTGSALAASTWYHVFLIAQADGSTTDILASTSATAPNLPSGYTKFRRIGAVKTNATPALLAFTQTGSSFVWTNSVTDFNASVAPTAALVALASVPGGVKVEAMIRAAATSSSAQDILLSSPDQADEAPAFPNKSLSFSAGGQSAGEFRIRTDTSGRLRTRGAASGAFGIQTMGWVDPRQ